MTFSTGGRAGCEEGGGVGVWRCGGHRVAAEGQRVGETADHEAEEGTNGGPQGDMGGQPRPAHPGVGGCVHQETS